LETWIVTGGAGFIGSNFVRHVLAAEAAAVVVLDKLTYAGHRENLDDVRRHPRFAFVEGDIADAPCVDRVLREHAPTAILNFAAETHVDRSIDAPADFLHTNVMGTFHLLEGVRRHLDALPSEARHRFRFLHVSTDEVYGTLGDSGLFSEFTPYAPNSPYAATKAAADHLVRAWGETFGVPVLLTNCSNNYGPYQFPEKLIPLMTLNALDGRPLPLYGDGAHVRDWLYVEDHCEGLVQVLRRAAPGSRYNLGGSAERRNLEVVDRICATLEAVAPASANPRLAGRGVTRYADLRTFVGDRRGHDRRYAIDTSLIRRELGWTPRRDFEEGIDRTVRWYVEHRDWCEAVQAGGGYRRERLGLA
jgi:dTDP-glucose 4,6-dehydratase